MRNDTLPLGHLEEAERWALREKKKLQAQRDLIAFTEFTMPRYTAAPLHHTIAGQLERVERGEIDRLMLLVAPRHGKSELASRRFPAYYLGRHPHKQFISASASASLAADFGRDVRNMIASPEYAEIFDTRLAEDSQAKDRWATQEGGSYYAVGVGSQIMGRGAHIFLCDDPFGSMEDAQSETERKRVWDWYQGSAYSRLEDNAAIVVINHRMHEDDLSGRLLAQQAAGGDKWEVVELKATPEAPLWPEKYDSEALARIRANTQPRFFSALYAQNPIPDDGTYFLSSYLKTYAEIPNRETLQIYMAADAAVSEGKGDYTAIVTAALDPEDRLHILDVYRAQASPDVWIDALLDRVLEYKPQVLAMEAGQIRLAIGPYLEKRMRERRAYVVVETIPSRHDKTVRAQSVRGIAAVRGIWLPTNAPWLADFRSELLAFPSGRHDDIVDAVALIGLLVDRMVPGQEPRVEKKPKVLSTDPSTCTVSLDDMWEQTDRHRRGRVQRIH